ncbi:hypothetical protein BsWGS_19652 [Bradybaena similaris]
MDGLELVLGTYDSLVLGYRLARRLDASYGLEISFTEDLREGALRCVHVSPSGTLVSSSSHSSVRLHNLVKRRSLGELYQHDDQVNCVAFYKQSHMLTASDDGTICMWKTKNWEMMRVLKGHKAHVLAVAVHPSGKLGLSVGSDRSLLTWDLLTGKLAFHRKITEAATNILFTPDGNHYILVYTKRIEICRLEDTSTVLEIPTSWRINSVVLLKDDVLAIGGDDRYIHLVDIFSGQELLTLDMARPQEDSFSSRVRCVCATVCDTQQLLVAATSAGNIKVFRVSVAERTSDVLLLHSAGVRVTCMAVHNPANSSLDTDSDAAKQTQKSSKNDVSRSKKRKRQQPSLRQNEKSKSQTQKSRGKKMKKASA